MLTNFDKKELLAKARGLTLSIDKMDAKQRMEKPNVNYGNDYNNLRTITARLYPDLAKLFPPAVSIYRGSEFGDYVEESYGEMNTYCEQIYQLLV